jgi:hypothetical protein
MAIPRDFLMLCVLMVRLSISLASLKTLLTLKNFGTNEGRIDAKFRGVKFGRKRSIDREKLWSLKQQGLAATDIAKKMGIGKSTVYKLLNEIYRL